MFELPTVLTFTSILLASLLGSPHCAGMCGGFVALYSHHSKSPLRAHITYSLGRLCTYLILGSLASILGSAFDQTFAVLGIQKVSTLIIGLVLISTGLIQLLALVSKALAPLRIMRTWGQRMSKLLSRVVPLGPIVNRPFLIGVSTTLLPCGWLYAFVALAFSLSLGETLMVMMTFWLGTLPMMLSIAALGRSLTQKLGVKLPIITALLIIVAGLFSLKSHLTPHSGNHHKTHTTGSFPSFNRPSSPLSLGALYSVLANHATIDAHIYYVSKPNCSICPAYNG